MVKPPNEYQIRLYKNQDLDGVLRIEKESFKHPWSPNMFEALFLINPEGFHVVSTQDQVVGYSIVLYEQGFGHTKKLGEAHLMNIAVDPTCQRQGIGTDLVNKMISKIRKAKLSRIHLEVRISNKTAITFYKKIGFTTVSTVMGFYGNEDALVMVKDIS
jgi:ribosomal-protein-alanine N-acetyltransferase